MIVNCRQIFLCCLAVLSCNVHAQKISDGAAYKAELISEIASASRIEVREHSSMWDFYDGAKSNLHPHAEKIYQVVNLTERDKKNFISLVSKVPRKTQDAIPMCIFEAHHTIFFLKNDLLSSSLQICFHCGVQNWDGTNHQPPEDIMHAFHALIQSIKLHPERDWNALAMQEQ